MWWSAIDKSWRLGWGRLQQCKSWKILQDWCCITRRSRHRKSLNCGRQGARPNYHSRFSRSRHNWMLEPFVFLHFFCMGDLWILGDCEAFGLWTPIARWTCIMSRARKCTLGCLQPEYTSWFAPWGFAKNIVTEKRKRSLEQPFGCLMIYDFEPLGPLDFALWLHVTQVIHQEIPPKIRKCWSEVVRNTIRSFVEIQLTKCDK